MRIYKIRKKSFKKWFDTNKHLDEMINGVESHSFLSNPPISNIYQYLTYFVAEASSNLFNKPVCDLSVLDWGTGKGHVSFFLKENGFGRVISCDIESSKEDSTFGQEHPIITKERIEVIPLKHDYFLPFGDNSFDIIVSYGVLEHVPNDQESLKEIYRVLKPGGLFFCFHLPRKFGYLHFIARLLGDNYHDRLYTRKSCESLISKAGFNLLDIWERTILPKNKLNFVANDFAEKLDQTLTDFTPLKYISTNIEFLAQKK